MEDLIVRMVARLVILFIQVYAIYIILHGHLSPGGGFAGGALFAASLYLYVLAFGLGREQQKIPPSIARILESSGALFYVLVGTVSVLLGGAFLANASAGFPLGTPGQLLSGGAIFLLLAGIGVKVASTMITLFNHLVEEEAD